MTHYLRSARFVAVEETLNAKGEVTSTEYSYADPIVIRETLYGDLMILDEFGPLTILNEKARQSLRNPPLCIDLFSGAGGASLGMQAAGFRTVGIELMKVACETYQMNLGYGSGKPSKVMPRTGDCIRADVCSLPLRPWIEPDVVWYSAPCQDFSILNRHIMKEGKNFSFKNYLVVVGAIQARLLHPKIVLSENVPPAMKSWQWRAAKEVLRLGGYDVRDYLINTVNYGVPQYRERVIMAASRIGKAPPPPRPTHGTPKEIKKGLKAPAGSAEHRATLRFMEAENEYQNKTLDEFDEDPLKALVDEILDTGLIKA